VAAPVRSRPAVPDLVANDTVIAVVQIVAAHLSDRLTTFTVTNGDTVDRIPSTLAATLGRGG